MAGVRFSRINANNYPFFVIFLKARDVLAFNKISGVSLYLGRQFVQYLSKTSSILNFLPKNVAIFAFSQVKLKLIGNLGSVNYTNFKFGGANS